MSIVHAALRRDLERARLVLATKASLTAMRREALAEHLLWLVDFLHHHHRGEDKHLWPAVRARNPQAGDLLDVMDADHRRIGPAMDDLEDAAHVWGVDPTGVADVRSALAALTRDLLPHLRREEELMMPVVARTFAQEEYDALTKAVFVKSKSFAQLGRELPFILDGLDPANRSHFLAPIPNPVQHIVIGVFGRGYKRRARVLWGGTPATAIPSLTLERLDRMAAA